MTIPFADRLASIETSAIRELFKLLGKPGIISFAGGFPDPSLFDIEGIRSASELERCERRSGAAIRRYRRRARLARRFVALHASAGLPRCCG